MCGINGLFQFAYEMDEDALGTKIHEMNKLITHRGPDAEGVYVDSQIALGMRRLSIIDLTTGNQPIFNEDRTMLIIMNGEIYNYRALREKLVRRGHSFTTMSDTEVVLHLYEDDGRECLKALEGMFVFAIYDIRCRELFIARDRFGEKPLYYAIDGRKMCFASELKSIIGTNLVDKVIDEVALSQYFQLTYIPAPRSIIKGVRKLPAATCLTVNSAGGSELYSYYSVPYYQETTMKDYDQCKEKLRGEVFRAVEERMVSDVPVGSFLSGGIDSTIITAILATLSSKTVDTFTVSFDKKEYDESTKAAAVARRYKTSHHLCRMSFDEALSAIDPVFANMDEPFADSSVVATYLVSRAASEHVKVVLTGDCGDELFAGYSKYLASHYSKRYLAIPKVIRNRVIEPLVGILPDDSTKMRQVKKVIRNAGYSQSQQQVRLMSLGFKDDEIARLLLTCHEQDFLSQICETYLEAQEKVDAITASQYVDLKTVLEGDMFPKVDRASMLASLETRAPLISKSVVECAYKIPSQFKIHGRRQKIIFKDAFSDMIPDEVLHASKHGFSIPVAEWLRNELRVPLENALSSEYLEEQGLFDSSYVSKIMEEHMSLKENRSGELWALYVFQEWYQRWMV